MRDCIVLFHDGQEYRLERRQTPSISSTKPVDFGLQEGYTIILVMSSGGFTSYKLNGKEVRFRG